MKNVIIYSTLTCVYCKMAKEYFTLNNIKYQEKDVSVDTSARSEMMLKSNQMGVPVIEIDDRIIIGFDKRKIDEALKI